ncbi:MAG: YtxH domain-containing protein [Alistipes sp.]|nr:YtxH domain-containing protein [Alistipes sp.]
MKNTTLSIVSLLGGMLIGSALTLALTPKTGEEMRHLVHDFIHDEIDKLHAACKDSIKPCDCEKK